MPTAAPAPSPTALPVSAADQLHALCDPLVLTYRTCLAEDRAIVEASGGAPFVCIARPAGTWLLVFYPADHDAFPRPPSGGHPSPGTVVREGLVAGSLGFLRHSALHDRVQDPWFLPEGDGRVREVQPFVAVRVAEASGQTG